VARRPFTVSEAPAAAARWLYPFLGWQWSCRRATARPREPGGEPETCGCAMSLRELYGLVVLVSGAAGAAGWAWWLAGPLLAEPSARSGEAGDEGPDVFLALAGPLLVASALPVVMILYALLNMASAPDQDDPRTVMDAHGAARRAIHRRVVQDLVKDTPSVNELSVAELSRLLSCRLVSGRVRR
jgi:hypothetical protein